MTGNAAIGKLWNRLRSGARWAWISETHRDRLPEDLDRSVMALQSSDRLHQKQGRSTCRVRFDGPNGPLSVYLKRHYQLPWSRRLAALFHPSGYHSDAGAEWRHLRFARELGIPIPEPVAVGEHLGPWASLQSYLMIEELQGFTPLHEAVPTMAERLPHPQFVIWKRKVIREVARMTSRIHQAKAFHKDLYLCHFFIHLNRDTSPMHLIDLHRLQQHQMTELWWRWKDLGQLLFSTIGVEGIEDADRLRFWVHYRRSLKPNWPRLQRRIIDLKARRYLQHNQKSLARQAKKA